jgi:hypothetical protein
MRAMSKSDPILAPETRSVQGSSPAKVPDDSPGSHAPGELLGKAKAREIGGRDGPEPTRFGDWEKSGRCIDF